MPLKPCIPAVAFVLSVAPVVGQPPADATPQALAAVANAYRVNLDAFQCYSCEYTVAWGGANSVDEAVAGKLVSTPRIASAKIFRRGHDVRFSLVEDAKTKAELDAPLKSSDYTQLNGMKVGKVVPFITSEQMHGKTHKIQFDARGRTVNVGERDATRGMEGYFLFDPLNVSGPNDFGVLADRVATGGVKVALAQPSATQLVAKFELPKRVEWRYTLDLSQGSLPVRIDGVYDEGRGGTLTVVVSKVRACSKGRFFPERITLVLRQSPTMPTAIVQDYVVTQLDTDACPPDEAFQLSLPAGTVVANSTDSRKHFITRRPETVSPSQLPQILAMTEAAPKTPLMDTAIPPAPQTPWWWYAAGGAVVVGAAYCARRAWRGRRSDAQA